MTKTEQALERTGLRRLCVGGGVAANQHLRAALKLAATRIGVELHIAPISLCTDNAVMGGIAVERFRAGQFDALDVDIEPGLVRG